MTRKFARRFPQPEKHGGATGKRKAQRASEAHPRILPPTGECLILISPKPVQLKKLNPKGSKLFSEDPNFRVAYNRFGSEPIFVFVNANSIDQEQEERRKQYEEDAKKAEEARLAAMEKAKAKQKRLEKKKPNLVKESRVKQNHQEKWSLRRPKLSRPQWKLRRNRPKPKC